VVEIPGPWEESTPDGHHDQRDPAHPLVSAAEIEQLLAGFLDTREDLLHEWEGLPEQPLERRRSDSAFGGLIPLPDSDQDHAPEPLQGDAEVSTVSVQRTESVDVDAFDGLIPLPEDEDLDSPAASEPVAQVPMGSEARDTSRGGVTPGGVQDIPRDDGGDEDDYDSIMIIPKGSDAEIEPILASLDPPGQQAGETRNERLLSKTIVDQPAPFAEPVELPIPGTEPTDRELVLEPGTAAAPLIVGFADRLEAGSPATISNVSFPASSSLQPPASSLESAAEPTIMATPPEVAPEPAVASVSAAVPPEVVAEPVMAPTPAPPGVAKGYVPPPPSLLLVSWADKKKPPASPPIPRHMGRHSFRTTPIPPEAPPPDDGLDEESAGEARAPGPLRQQSLGFRQTGGLKWRSTAPPPPIPIDGGAAPGPAPPPQPPEIVGPPAGLDVTGTEESVEAGAEESVEAAARPTEVAITAMSETSDPAGPRDAPHGRATRRSVMGHDRPRRERVPPEPRGDSPGPGVLVRAIVSLGGGDGHDGSRESCHDISLAFARAHGISYEKPTTSRRRSHVVAPDDYRTGVRNGLREAVRELRWSLVRGDVEHIWDLVEQLETRSRQE
jgi:hypothetical protein